MSIETTEVADVAQTALPAVQTPAERAALALLSTPTEMKLTQLVEVAKTITAVTNAAGRDECHAHYMAIKNSRIDIEKKAKEIRSDAEAFKKSVTKEEERLIAITNAEEKRLQKLRDDFDTIEKERKAEIERKEKERIDNIQLRIHSLATMPARTATAAEIGAHLEALRNFPIDDTFEEFKDVAEKAKTDAIGAILLLHSEARRAEKLKADEEERQRIERERIEKEKAELTEQKRKQDEEAAAEKKRMDDERAEIARQKQELADAAAKVEADRKALEAAEVQKRLDEQLADQVPPEAEIVSVNKSGSTVSGIVTDEEKQLIKSTFEDASESFEKLASADPVAAENVVDIMSARGKPAPWNDEALTYEVLTGEEKAIAMIDAITMSPEELDDRDDIRAWLVACLGLSPLAKMRTAVGRETVEGIAEMLFDEREIIDLKVSGDIA